MVGVLFIGAEICQAATFTGDLIWGWAFYVLNFIAIASIVYSKIGRYLGSPELESGEPLFLEVFDGIACRIC